MNFLRHTIQIALLSAVVANTALAVTYKATLLNQFGGYSSGIAYGAFNNSQVGAASSDTILSDAILWNAAAGTATDLNPAGFEVSVAYAADGPTQVGRGFGPATANQDHVIQDHALLWRGTASSAIDLHPSGFINSYAYGVSGNKQVGYASTNESHLAHAILWKGTAESAVDLNPDGFGSSYAMGITGNHQIGYGYLTTGGTHALLWKGTAASAIDLQPDGFVDSVGQAISGDSQVGYGRSFATSYEHALLWKSSAASAVDLHPSGFDRSFAIGVAGGMQVGWAEVRVFPPPSGPWTDIDHAFLWHETSQSAVDLHQFLAELSPTMTQSRALAVANNGTIAGYCQDIGGNSYPVLWSPIPGPGTKQGQPPHPRELLVASPVPEPSTLAMLYVGVFTAAIAARMRCGSKLRR